MAKRPRSQAQIDAEEARRKNTVSVFIRLSKEEASIVDMASQGKRAEWMKAKALAAAKRKAR